MKKEDFIFTDISSTVSNVAKLGKFYYYLDEKTGKLLFKTKYDFEPFDYSYFKFIIGKNVYITTKSGSTILKLDLDKFNSLMKVYPTKSDELIYIPNKLQLLNEYSFSRVYNKLKNGTCAMMTAYRGTNSHTENERRQKSLKQELQKLGYSFNEFNGYYIEDAEDTEKYSETKPQAEKYLLIYTQNLKDFKENIIELGDKYDQDTILYIKDSEGFLIGIAENNPDFPIGKEVSIGKVTASKIAQIYSERNGKTFIFESMQPDGMFSGYAFKATENNRVTENDTMREAKEKIEAKIKSLIERGGTPFIKEDQEIADLLYEINLKELAVKFQVDEIHNVFFDKKKYYIAKKNKLWGVIDKNGKVIIDFKYCYITYGEYFKKSDTLCFVVQDCKTKKFGVIDIKENIIIPFDYDFIHDWNIDTQEETFVVEKNGKCGVIDINNNILVDFKFKHIFSYMKWLGNYTFAQNEDDLWGIMNRKGEILHIDLADVKEVNATTLKRKAKKHSEDIYFTEKLHELYLKIHPKKPKQIRKPRIKKFKNNSECQLKLFK